MYNERSFVEYMYDLRKRIIRIILAIAAVTIFCLVFSISIYNFNGYKIPLPHPDMWNNISVQTIYLMNTNLLPRDVNLIQLTPQGAFLTEIYSAIMLSIIVAMPIIVRELASFIGPGLYRSEKTLVKRLATYAVVLFAGGCLFSYFIVIPLMLSFLYKYGQAMGVNTFFDIGEFIPFVMQFVIIFGLSYQLPMIMWALTRLGIFEYTFWRSKLRYAVLICSIFGAFITPDGSGVTMWFIAGPMILLYVIGMLIIESKIKQIQQQKEDRKQQLI